MMTMETCDYFHGDFIHGDNPQLWPFSPGFQPFDAFPDLMMQEVEASSELSNPPPPPQPIINPSAFQRISRSGCQGLTHLKSPTVAGERRNIHQRVIDVLRRMPKMQQEAESEIAGAKGAEMSRGFRHMMRERQRREKLSQSYADQHGFLQIKER